MSQQDTKDHYSALCNIRSIVTQEFSEFTYLWLVNSVMSKTYKILLNESSQIIGYIIWAEISKDSFMQIARLGVFPKYSFEWQEGNITLILEIVVNDIDKSSAFKQLRQFVKNKKILTFIKKNRGKLYIKKNNKRYLTSSRYIQNITSI